MNKQEQQKIEDRLESAFRGAFMQPFISECQNWYIVEDFDGDKAFDCWGDACDFMWERMEDADGSSSSVEIKTGYGAWTSAPGYMDCTDTVVFDSFEDAAEYLIDYHGNEGD